MKSWLWKGMLAVAIALPAQSGVVRAQSTDDDGCTNATLRGDYAFSVVDFILHKLEWASGDLTAMAVSHRLITSAIAFGRPERPALEAVRLAATRSIPTAQGAKRSS